MMSDRVIYACPACGRSVVVTYPTVAMPPTTCYCQMPNAVVQMVQLPPVRMADHRPVESKEGED